MSIPTPPAGLCIAGTVPPGDTTTTRCTHPGGHDGPHSWDWDDDLIDLDDVHETLGLATESLGIVIDWLAEIRRGARPEAREQLDLATERVQASWAMVVLARAAVRDVRL